MIMFEMGVAKPGSTVCATKGCKCESATFIYEFPMHDQFLFALLERATVSHCNTPGGQLVISKGWRRKNWGGRVIVLQGQEAGPPGTETSIPKQSTPHELN